MLEIDKMDITDIYLIIMVMHIIILAYYIKN
jgi:hypothetical protein